MDACFCGDLYQGNPAGMVSWSPGNSKMDDLASIPCLFDVVRSVPHFFLYLELGVVVAVVCLAFMLPLILLTFSV